MTYAIIDKKLDPSIMSSMFDILKGSKVILRPFVETDITPEYISWLNDPVVVKYSNQRFLHHTEESCLKYLNSFKNTPNLFISIQTKYENLFVGTMTAYVSSFHKTVDIGILIGNRSYWGTGIGQDAWNVLINWFIDIRGMRKVTAGTMGCNKPMIKLMERSGMILEAIRHNQELLDNIPQDILYYSRFRDF